MIALIDSPWFIFVIYILRRPLRLLVHTHTSLQVCVCMFIHKHMHYVHVYAHRHGSTHITCICIHQPFHFLWNYAYLCSCMPVYERWGSGRLSVGAHSGQCSKKWEIIWLCQEAGMRSLLNKCKLRPVKALKAVEDGKCTNNHQIEVLMMKYQSLVRVLTPTV